MVEVLHYYCKKRRAELLNNISFKKGISIQVNTDYLDISDIVKEVNNKNHIDCVAIDEELFGIGDAEDIISKIEVLKFLAEDTKVLIIALDRMRDDEIIQAVYNSGFVDFMVTKEMANEFETVVSKFFDGEAYAGPKNEYKPEREIEHEIEYVEEKKNNEKPNVIKNTLNRFVQMKDAFTQSTDDTPDEEIKEIPADRMITIGVCGLQSHIGATHHALAMAQFLSGKYSVCYIEKNTRNVYKALQSSHMKSDRAGYIRIKNVDIYDRNTNIDDCMERYRFCVVDFGTIGESKSAEFNSVDIPIIVAGVKDWEFGNLLGAYQTGALDNANVLVNFLSENEQDELQSAFENVKMFFAEYAPDVFNPTANLEVYNDIINTNMEEM